MRLDGLLSGFILLAALAAGVFPCSARAAVVYDGFDYPAGVDLSGQDGGVGWAGAWFDRGFGPQTFTTAAGLGFGNLEVTPGAATNPSVNAITTYPRFFADPVGADGTTLYLSFLLRPESNFGFYGGLNLGGFFIGKSGTPVTTYSLEGGTVGNIAASSVVAQAGTTVLLVLRAQFQSGNDRFDLYVDPVPGLAEPSVADATMSNVDLNLAAPNNNLYINNPGGWTIDEIRLGSTFADVTPTAVPAPSPPLLIALGLVAVGLARRRAKG